MNNNQILDAIITGSPKTFETLLEEARERIENCWAQIREQSEEQEKKPSLKVGFHITVDPGDLTIDYALQFGARHKVTSKQTLEDPKQPELLEMKEETSGKRKKAA